jgi:hypothetical protein
MPEICPGYSPDQAADQDSADGPDAGTATDREWHLSPLHPHAFCGGCGMEAADCHPGFCCTNVEDRMGVHTGVCDLCSHRHQTGQAVAP